MVANGDRGQAAALTAVVEDLAGELSLRPLLERILKRSTELLGCDAGSICLVDEAAGVYRKEADIGIACQSGKVFPLSEGTTGALVSRRGPVIFENYADVPGGHVRPEDREALKGVIGVPIWWRGQIVGSLVVFTRDPSRAFVEEDAELLELFAKHAAIAITNARLHEAAESNARAEAAAAERNRMAREVHDAFAQGLVSVLLQLRAAQGAIADGHPDEATAALAEARTAAEAVFEETRRSVLGSGALAARRAHAGGSAGVGARVGEPHRRDRRTSGDGRQPGGAGPRGRAHAVPDRAGGAHERDPSRAGDVRAGRARLRADGRHAARAGRRRGVRSVAPGRRGSGTRSGAGRHGRTRPSAGRHAGARVDARLGDPDPRVDPVTRPSRPTRSTAGRIPCGSWWSTITR